MTNAEEFKMLYNEQLISQGSDPYDYTQWTGNTDWQNEIFQTGFLTNNNVSITGATERVSFIWVWVTSWKKVPLKRKSSISLP